LLVLLAEYADEGGVVTGIGTHKLGRLTGRHQQAVVRTLRSMVKGGLLTIETPERAGPRFTRTYRLQMGGVR
jgi:hypothetical protein